MFYPFQQAPNILLLVISTDNNGAFHNLLGHNILCPYQRLSFSYPKRINKSPATSLKSFLCSSEKYFFHSPVFPERKVGERCGLIEASKESRINCRGAGSGMRVRRWSMIRERVAARSLIKSSKWMLSTCGQSSHPRYGAKRSAIFENSTVASGLPKMLTLSRASKSGNEA